MVDISPKPKVYYTTQVLSSAYEAQSVEVPQKLARYQAQHIFQ
jgi:hypothetical protein